MVATEETLAEAARGAMLLALGHERAAEMLGEALDNADIPEPAGRAIQH